jgi:hypothetical protein
MKLKYLSLLFFAVFVFLLLNIGSAFLAVGGDLEAFDDPAKQAETIADNPTLINISMVTDFLWYISFTAANILIGKAVIRRGRKELGMSIIGLAFIYGAVGAYAAILALSRYNQIPELYAVDPNAAIDLIKNIKTQVFDHIWGTWNNITAFFLWLTVVIALWKRAKLFALSGLITGLIHGFTTVFNLTGKSDLASQGTIVYILLGVIIYFGGTIALLTSKKFDEALFGSK